MYLEPWLSVLVVAIGCSYFYTWRAAQPGG